MSGDQNPSKRRLPPANQLKAFPLSLANLEISSFDPESWGGLIGRRVLVRDSALVNTPEEAFGDIFWHGIVVSIDWETQGIISREQVSAKLVVQFLSGDVEAYTSVSPSTLEIWLLPEIWSYEGTCPDLERYCIGKFDFCVVGGGPAGLQAAAKLEASGTVAVLESRGESSLGGKYAHGIFLPGTDEEDSGSWFYPYKELEHLKDAQSFEDSDETMTDSDQSGLLPLAGSFGRGYALTPTESVDWLLVFWAREIFSLALLSAVASPDTGKNFSSTLDSSVTIWLDTLESGNLEISSNFRLPSERNTLLSVIDAIKREKSSEMSRTESFQKITKFDLDFLQSGSEEAAECLNISGRIAGLDGRIYSRLFISGLSSGETLVSDIDDAFECGEGLDMRTERERSSDEKLKSACTDMISKWIQRARDLNKAALKKEITPALGKIDKGPDSSLLASVRTLETTGTVSILCDAHVNKIENAGNFLRVWFKRKTGEKFIECRGVIVTSKGALRVSESASEIFKSGEDQDLSDLEDGTYDQEMEEDEEPQETVVPKPPVSSGFSTEQSSPLSNLLSELSSYAPHPQSERILIFHFRNGRLPWAGVAFPPSWRSPDCRGWRELKEISLLSHGFRFYFFDRVIIATTSIAYSVSNAKKEVRAALIALFPFAKIPEAQLVDHFNNYPTIPPPLTQLRASEWLDGRMRFSGFGNIKPVTKELASRCPVMRPSSPTISQSSGEPKKRGRPPKVKQETLFPRVAVPDGQQYFGRKVYENEFSVSGAAATLGIYDVTGYPLKELLRCITVTPEGFRFRKETKDIKVSFPRRTRLSVAVRDRQVTEAVVATAQSAALINKYFEGVKVGRSRQDGFDPLPLALEILKVDSLALPTIDQLAGTRSNILRAKELDAEWSDEPETETDQEEEALLQKIPTTKISVSKQSYRANILVGPKSVWLNNRRSEKDAVRDYRVLTLAMQFIPDNDEKRKFVDGWKAIVWSGARPAVPTEMPPHVKRLVRRVAKRILRDYVTDRI